MTLRILPALALSLALSLAATPPAALAAGKGAEAKKPAAAAPAPLATLNGEIVNEKAFAAYVNWVIEARPGTKEEPDQRELLLRRFCGDIHLARKASKEGLTERIRDQLYESQLTVLSRFYREKVVFEGIEATDAEVDGAIGEVLDELYISQITTADENSALEAHAKLVGGAAFRDVVRQHSVGLAAKGEGRLGVFDRNDPRWSDDQRAAIVALAVGEFTRPFETPVGWGIVRVDRITPAWQIREARRKEVRPQILNAKQRAAENRTFAEMRAKADIWVDEEFFSSGAKDPSRPYLAKVNNTTINADALTGSPGMPHQFNVHSFQVERGLLEDKIKEILFQEDAVRRKMDRDPEYLMVLDTFRVRQLASAYIARHVGDFSSFQPTEEEIAEFYATNYKPEIQAIRAILVKEKAEAERIAKELAEGADFGDLATKHSLDSSASKGGALGYHAQGTLIEEVNPWLSKLKVNEVSPPIKAAPGYFLIQITDRRTVEVPPLDRMRPKIISTIQMRRRSEKIEQFVNEQTKDMKVVINEKALADLQL